MDIALSVAILLILAWITWVSLLLHKHGRPGLYRLMAARLRARADGIDAGREKHRESLAFYLSELKPESKSIQETL